MCQLSERFLKSVFKENKSSDRLKNFNCLEVGAVSINKLTIEDQLLNCVSNVSAFVKETTASKKDTKWEALFLSFNILLDMLIIDDFLSEEKVFPSHILLNFFISFLVSSDAEPVRICGKDVPLPYAENLEKNALPLLNQIIQKAKEVCYYRDRN